MFESCLFVYSVMTAIQSAFGEWQCIIRVFPEMCGEVCPMYFIIPSFLSAMPKTLLDFFGGAAKKPKLMNEASSKPLSPSPAKPKPPAKVKPSPSLQEKPRNFSAKENRAPNKKRNEKDVEKEEVDDEEEV